MPQFDDITQPHITSFEHDYKRLQVTARIVFDGIEFVGRLWFHDESWDDAGVPDRGALTGTSRDEVIARAKALNIEQVAARYRRAMAEKRQFKGLRRATEDVLSKIRYLNQVSVSMRAGLLDLDGAAQEIDLTEKQLHELVDRLRAYAGTVSES